MSNYEKQQPGLGGALYAVYGVVPEAREVRVWRPLGHFLVAAVKRARNMVADTHSGKGLNHQGNGRAGS